MWNKKINDYKTLTKKEIDYNTFNDKLAKFEIEDFKNKRS